ncbi:MAG: hypothetical protein Q4A05_09205 [Ruminococcus sp.]|nr:hypothetical protein [Ruminococcus sp.]
MTATLSIKSPNASDTVFKVLAFTFSKDVYTPFTQLTVEFEAHTAVPESAQMAWFYVNGSFIHRGYIDTFRITEKGGFRRGVITSRGFTSQYLQNQLAPGLYTNMSLNDLMDDYMQLPYVTHEDCDTASYIFVKNGSTQWDGIVNIAFKVYGKHPYIRGTNCVMVNRDSEAKTFAYSEASMLSRGTERDTRSLVYYWSMEDMQGQHGSYTLSEPDAYDNFIYRSRYFELDRRFLYDPQKALEFRDKMAMRGWKNSFFTYSGYRGEDLFDTATVGGVSSDITSVRITGSRNGIITEIGSYTDKFVGVQ